MNKESRIKLMGYDEHDLRDSTLQQQQQQQQQQQ